TLRSWKSRGERYGFRSPQRKRFLPGAQCAPRRKSAATASCAFRGPRANHGTRGARGLEETPVRGAQLAGFARTGQQSLGLGGSEFAGRAEIGGGIAHVESGSCGLVSADRPNF